MQGVALAREDRLKAEDAELFDDSDFYHHLLQEFIQHKNSSDPVVLTKFVTSFYLSSLRNSGVVG